VESRPPPRWWSVFVTVGWISMALGGIQIYVGGAGWMAIMPGFALLVLFALPEWLHKLEIPRPGSNDS
jgi:hypothetical protein